MQPQNHEEFPDEYSAVQEPAGDCQCRCRALADTVRQLRDPGGCPWDGEQTHESLRPNLLEECYETLEALDRADHVELQDELGDLMIQIAFHADIARRRGDFDLDSICAAANSKLRRRHAHVFGDAPAMDTAQNVVDAWERIKRAEAGGTRSIVASVPADLPAAALAAILVRRATRAGLDLDEYTRSSHDAASGPAAKSPHSEQQAGRMLMAQVAAVQEAGFDPEAALRKLCLELRDRILRAEGIAGETALADLHEDRRAEVWRNAAEATDA